MAVVRVKNRTATVEGPREVRSEMSLREQDAGLDRAHEEESGGQNAPRFGLWWWHLPGWMEGKDRGDGRRKDWGGGEEGRMKGSIHLDSIPYR